MATVTRKELVEAIRSLGVKPGELMLVHSSLSSFGRVEGGAVEVAQALVDSISPDGTVFVPTFNYGTEVYSPAETRSMTGAITEAFRKLPDAQRSLQPTHPVAAIGKEARAILDGHERVDPFGPGSPLWRLYERDAWVLLMGCDHRSSSMIHVAEEVAELPYLHRTRTAKARHGEGVIEYTVRRPGCSHGFNRVDDFLREAGAIREGGAGNSRLMLMSASDLVDAALSLLVSDPGALLCSRSECENCAQARLMLADEHGSATK